ncbi:MAG: 50S ribosomal protein L17 [bacterium]|nr:50S ribosomal protein L17 [bacterium]
MRHQVRGNRLNRPADHRRAMLRNMVTSLFKSERITTTVTKAKTARRHAERMITFAKRGDLHSRRQAARFIFEPKVLQKLFDEIGPRYAERPGGYTRVIKAGIRKGDDASMAILELVEAEYKPKGKKRVKKVAEPKVEAAPVVEEAPVEESVVEETETEDTETEETKGD